MKLLLDEMYSAEIAAQLRDRGYDVVSAKENPDLVGQDDETLLATATAQGRTLLTNNVGDFIPIIQQLVNDGSTHAGILFTNDRSMPRRRGAIGMYLAELERFMESRPDDDAMRDQARWLPDAP